MNAQPWWEASLHKPKLCLAGLVMDRGCHLKGFQGLLQSASMEVLSNGRMQQLQMSAVIQHWICRVDPSVLNHYSVKLPKCGYDCSDPEPGLHDSYCWCSFMGTLPNAKCGLLSNPPQACPQKTHGLQPLAHPRKPVIHLPQSCPCLQARWASQKLDSLCTGRLNALLAPSPSPLSLRSAMRKHHATGRLRVAANEQAARMPTSPPDAKP